MKSPYTGKEMTLRREPRKLKFRKDEFDVLYHTYFCQDSKENFEDDKLSELNIKQVHNQYREKHKLPFSEEIKEIREKYGLSARKMSEILGFGVNSYSNYENGDIPEIANGRIILMAANPKNFRELALKAGLLDEKLDRRIKHLIERRENEFDIWEMFFAKSPSSKNGYKTVSQPKVLMAIRYFSEILSPWKTKMNKLLFYADFLNYRNHCESITGLEYKAIPLGPVPENYDHLYGIASSNGFVEINEEPCHDFLGECFKANKIELKYGDVFTDDELNTLKTVSSHFAKTTAREIKELSHKEKAWLENYKTKSLIDYSYGFEIVGI